MDKWTMVFAHDCDVHKWSCVWVESKQHGLIFTSFAVLDNSQECGIHVM